MKTYQTAQEEFWAGSFGDDYTNRNQNELLQASNLNFFKQIFARTNNVRSTVEFGANRGLNLKAIKSIFPSMNLTAVEINEKAVEELRSIPGVTVHHNSILEVQLNKPKDFVLTKGVLIHQNPDVLGQVYDLLYNSSRQYICIAEYYNPVPVAIAYRGHSEKLFKRDFAGELLDRCRDVKLVDYGFVYHRDQQYPQDDITWFLLSKF